MLERVALAALFYGLCVALVVGALFLGNVDTSHMGQGAPSDGFAWRWPAALLCWVLAAVCAYQALSTTFKKG